MAFKIKIGKLNIEYPLVDFIDMAIEKHQLKLLNISLQHIFYTQQLELIHRDPFDRIIAAQALVENMKLISSDEIFDSYNVNRLWQLK